MSEIMSAKLSAALQDLQESARAGYRTVVDKLRATRNEVREILGARTEEGSRAAARRVMAQLRDLRVQLAQMLQERNAVRAILGAAQNEPSTSAAERLVRSIKDTQAKYDNLLRIDAAIPKPVFNHPNATAMAASNRAIDECAARLKTMTKVWEMCHDAYNGGRGYHDVRDLAEKVLAAMEAQKV